MLSLNIKNPKPKGQGFVGKVRRTTDIGDYNIYGSGRNPFTVLYEQDPIRRQYAQVQFKLSDHPEIGEMRKLKCLIPKVILDEKTGEQK